MKVLKTVHMQFITRAQAVQQPGVLHTDIDNVGEEWPPPFLACYLDPVFRNILIHAVDFAHPIVVCMDVEWLRNIDPFSL